MFATLDSPSGSRPVGSRFARVVHRGSNSKGMLTTTSENRWDRDGRRRQPDGRKRTPISFGRIMLRRAGAIYRERASYVLWPHHPIRYEPLKSGLIYGACGGLANDNHRALDPAH